MFRKRNVLFSLLLVLALTISLTSIALADTPPNQTTLSAEKTATGHWVRTFNWTIDKSVTPSTLNMFRGDSGDVTYTIAVTKDSGTDTFYVDGQICVTNGGAVPTENLAIVDEIQYKVGSGKFQTLSNTSLDLSEKPVLDAGETHCYSYSIDFTPVDGAEYRNVAHVTITNHAGWEPGDNNCPGDAPCPFGPDPKADFSLPDQPTLVHDSINVDDTNGDSWPFNNSGSESYSATFSCDGDEGKHDNTATIRETDQSDSARVTVHCYALTVTKNANTSFTRTYDWGITKSADQSSLTLALNQSFLVNYSVTVDRTGLSGYTDSDWAVSGDITISNPAPMVADLADVSDVVSSGITANVDCPTMTVPAGGELDCTYTADLPNADSRTNSATATLQNTPSGTTDFSGTAAVSFSSADINRKDTCVDVTDTFAGTLGTACYTDTLPKTFTYSRSVGPYDVCGPYTVDNTASFITNDTDTTGSASWTVNVNVPCNQGCTLTIGYWKNHAGFGPQADMVTPLLPQYLGTQLLGVPLGKSIKVTTNSQAVQYLSFNGSNNIFDASNGINKLYAQLLAAKLNIQNGANGSSVSSTIFAADTFLTTHNSLDWASLSKSQKNQVLNWMTTLDNFNNGLVGPGHCSQ